MIGQKIAHYTITEKIGAGGMGEVFRARDEKLNRDVALKILPHAYAADKERMGRFQREARLLASLNHANIAAIYGLEQEGDVNALVLELVEGDDLSVTMKSRSFSQEEALEIAVQIAEALEFAHEAGIVHRDLKPSNVKVTPDGKVKVLDFGLAKVFQEDSGDEQSGMTMSPTLSIAASVAGVILGTAAYMSPEQARGKQVDRRADIWAFGVVLFEMLSGRQLFAGETISDTLAAVIKDEADYSLLPPATPPLVVDLIKRCLEKSPRRRLQSMGEARIALDEALSGPKSGSASPTLLSASLSQSVLNAPPVDAAPEAPRSSRMLLWILALVVVGASGWLIGRGAGGSGHSSSLSTSKRIFSIVPSELKVAYPTPPALSPDGRRYAFFNAAGLHIRDFDNIEGVDVPGTGEATSPFWSPDGQWLAFGMNGRIYKVPATGGTPSVICDVSFSMLDGGFWGDDGNLVLAPNAGPLYTVSERGGDAVPLFTPGAGETDYHTPCVLPGGRGILFTTHNAEGRDRIEVYANGERKLLLHIPSARLEYAAWSPSPGSTDQGFVVYHRQQNNAGIWAFPFDLNTLEVTGEPVLLNSDGSFPSLGRDGSLMFSTGSGGGLSRIVITDRQGKILQSVGPTQMDMRFPRASLDGRSILVSASENDNQDIWLLDIQRDTRTRVSFDPATEQFADWMNDGRDIYFSRGTSDAHTMVRPADGTADAETLLTGYQMTAPDGASHFAHVVFVPQTGQDIHYFPRGKPEESKPFLATRATELTPQISPDGRYIIYMSTESGGNQIYLKPFPEGRGKWQVSIDGGGWPTWNHAGDEILYRSGAGASARMMVVSVSTDGGVQLGTPEELFNASTSPTLVYGSGYRGYAYMPDDERLIMLESAGRSSQPTTRLVFLENWHESYRELVQ